MFKIGDKVRQKFTVANRIGTVIGIWEDDEYVTDKEGNSILLASKGELKVQFDNNSQGVYSTFSNQEVIKL
jgi:hypothetical protein